MPKSTHEPVFGPEDIDATYTFDLTAALPVEILDGQQWAVTLCGRVAHDDALALWGVAPWESLQSPVGCFLAPVLSSREDLEAWARAILGVYGQDGNSPLP